MTQIADVFALLKSGKTLTEREAFSMGIGRLSARVLELKSAGHPIDKRMITVIKSNGKKTRVAQYFMTERANG